MVWVRVLGHLHFPLSLRQKTFIQLVPITRPKLGPMSPEVPVRRGGCKRAPRHTASEPRGLESLVQHAVPSVLLCPGRGGKVTDSRKKLNGHHFSCGTALGPRLSAPPSITIRSSRKRLASDGTRSTIGEHERVELHTRIELW